MVQSIIVQTIFEVFMPYIVIEGAVMLLLGYIITERITTVYNEKFKEIRLSHHFEAWGDLSDWRMQVENKYLKFFFIGLSLMILGIPFASSIRGS